MKNWQKSCIKSKSKISIITILVVLVLVAAVFSICIGAVFYSPLELFTKDSQSVAYKILHYSRIPRTCCSLLAGAALAVAGAVIQTVLANPLAAPNIIGVNSGAGFMVALCCAFMPFSPWAIPVAAFVGAALGVFIVLGIAEGVGASKSTMILAGVAISSLFAGATDAVVTFVPEALAGYTDFRIGGFRGVTMERVVPAAVFILIGFILVLCLTHEMDVLALGTETAHSLGVKVRPIRILLLTGAALLAGAAVSFSGIIGFVGLLVPHIIRKILGADALILVLGSALGGAFLVTVCDTLARSIFTPFELPVGIILSLLGAPFFLGLLLKQRKRRTH